MAKSNISNKQKKLPAIKQYSHAFIHIVETDYIPKEFKYINLNDISNIADNTLDVVLVADLFDYIQYSELVSTLDIIYTKLKSGGKFIVQAPDLYSLSCAISFNDIDIDTAKALLYESGKTNIYNIYDIENELITRNFDIIQKRFINIFEYYIETVKKP